MSWFLVNTTLTVGIVFGLTYALMQATTPAPGSNFPPGSPYEKYTTSAYEQNLLRGLKKQVREKIEKEDNKSDN